MKVKEILKITDGKLLRGRRDADIDLSKVSTDSRTIKRGEFFIALSGPNYCGSLFLKDAFKKGALGAIVEGSDIAAVDTDKILIKVKDAVKALQDIAASHRDKFKIPVIGITGSNGKTTVKEMIASVLSEKYNVLKSEGTKNNHIGVPQTLLKLKKEHEICVLEFGTNHKGEIETLSHIARPTLGVITNIGPSHLEHFTDIDSVYKEKRHILDSLGKGGIAVINGDDPLLMGIKSGRFKILRYGLGKSNDLRASDISTNGLELRFKVNDGREYLLKLLGVHNVHNALAAIAVASQFKVSSDAVRKAFLNFKPASMRLDPLDLNGIFVINDSYNSNPASMKTALDAIRSYSGGSKWIVSGDMLELGREAAHFHRLAGELIADSAATGLFTFGELSKYTLSGALEHGMGEKSLRHCNTHNEIADMLKTLARAGDVVLIKGSRGMRMEKVIERLKG